MVDKLRRAVAGRLPKPRGNPAWQTAANYLEAAGYPEAAAELHRAARSRSAGAWIWTPHRLAAWTRAVREAKGIHSKYYWSLAIDLYVLLEFCSRQAFALMKSPGRIIDNAKLAPLHRAIADLSAALLDITEPGWRRKQWTLEAVDGD